MLCIRVMKYNSRKRLNFFLNLINTNLTKVSGKDLLWLWVQAMETAYEGQDYQVLVPKEDLVPGETSIRNRLETFQTSAKDILKRMLAFHSSGVESKTPQIVRELRDETMVLYDKGRVSIAYKTFEIKLIIEFIAALAIYGINLIHNCKECGGYFLKGTKKEKHFCGTRCYLRWRRKRELEQ